MGSVGRADDDEEASVTTDDRAKLEQFKKLVRSQREELDLLRDFTRHPFDDIELSPRVEEVVQTVRERRLTYLGAPDLRLLAEMVVRADRVGDEGVIIEAGTALGGSAIAMAAAKAPDRVLRVYDVFGMIPPPTEEDGADVQERYEVIRSGGSRGLGGDTYYGYREDLLGEVTDNFRSLAIDPEVDRVELVEGLFEDTISIDGPVAFAHLDGDWYASTMVCLERIAPHLVPGGRLVLDDYYHWSGCRTAVDEYVAGRRGYRVEHRARVHVVREG